jgi:hypothetical protein
MKSFFGVYLLLLTGGILSCSPPESRIPSEIIPPDSMVLILSDFYLAQAVAGQTVLAQDILEIKKSLYQHILTTHQLNYERLRQSLEFYSAHPEIFASISENVIQELSRRQADAATTKSSPVR